MSRPTEKLKVVEIGQLNIPLAAQWNKDLPPQWKLLWLHLLGIFSALGYPMDLEVGYYTTKDTGIHISQDCVPIPVPPFARSTTFI